MIPEALDPAARIAAVLPLVSALVDQPRTVELVQGGLTNVNYKVSTPTRAAVVRLSAPADDLLAIDRDAEHLNSTRAAESGAAPPVLAYLPDHRALVVQWVDGRTLSAADLADEATLVRAATACRLLHAGPRFVADFDMPATMRRYLDIVQSRGFRMPSRYLDLLPVMERVGAAIAVRRGVAVPCNNDLLAANFVDDGDRLWIIDYEYGGNNDAAFELGNMWSESNLSLDHLTLLVDSYYGHHLRHQVARARLLGITAQYGWALWASIQDAVSPLDFDFWSWGMEKYDRAVEELDGPALEQMLADAVRRD